jgi:hypothetical protein
MKNAVICSLLFTALITQPAAAHTTIAKMLRDTAINHDLDKVRINLLKVQRRVDAEDRLRAGGKDVSYHAQEAEPVTHP